MKKILAIILAAAMAVTLLAACGSGSGSAATTAAPADTQAAPAETKADDATAAAEPSTEGNTDAEYREEEAGGIDAMLGALAKKSAPGEYFGDLLTIACSTGVNSWDPFARGGGFGVMIGSFESLGQADKQGRFRMQMLKSIEKVDDLTYNMEIWPFIEDTDGHNITASDVKWSVEAYRAAGNEGAVAKLDNIEVTGDYTFVWHNKSPFTIGEYEKQISNPRIVSQEAYESDPDQMANNPVGTGAYKLKEFVEASYAIFEVNEDYWFNKIDDEAWLAENDYVWSYQNYKEVRLDVITDASARAIALENGSVDACASMNNADVQNYANNPDISTIDIPVNPPVGFYFNMTENSPCSDINLRQAICYAIDNAGVAAGLDVPAFPVYGMQPRMYDSPENWITGEGRDYYNYNVDKAKECLEKSNYKGETLKVLFTDLDQRGSTWILVQAQLAEVGINVELNMAEQSTMQEKRYDFNSWDILSDTFGGGSYVPNVVRRWTKYDAAELNGKNTAGIEDATIDDLFDNMMDNYSEQAILDWDQYFTYDMCYGYAICCFNNQTCCLSKYIPVITGNQNQLTPGAFTPAE